MRFLKWLLITASVLFLLFISTMLILKETVLTGDRLKAIAIPKVEEATGRKVNVKRVELSLLGSVRLEGISVRGKGETFRADTVSIRFSLLPLLRKRFIVSSVKVEKGSIQRNGVSATFSGSFRLRENFPAGGYADFSLRKPPLSLRGSLELDGNRLTFNVKGSEGGKPLTAKGEVVFSRMSPEGVRSGNVKVENLSFGGVDVEGATFTYALLKDRLTVSSIDGKVAGGSFTGEVSYLTGRKRVRGWLKLRGIKVEELKPLLKDSSIRSCTVESLNSTFGFSARSERAVRETLTGKVEFNLKDISLKQGRLTSALESFILGIEGVKFDSGSGKAVVVNGKGTLNASFISKEMKVYIEGGRFTASGKLNMPITVVASGREAEGIRRKPSLIKLLSLKNGNVQLHLRLMGTVSSPVVVPESRAVESLPKRIENFFKKLFH